MHTKYRLHEYNGTMWLLDPQDFDTFEELSDYMTARAETMEPDQAEAYWYNSKVEELANE